LSNPAHVLLIGLPGSGKTTFLAALWHVLEERSSTTSLKLTGLSVDRTYLNQIAEEWRACSQVQRTNLQTEEMVVLHVDGDELGAFDLTVPDLSGEAFEQQLTERKTSAHHDELVQRATGVILFVHPDVQKGTQLTQARRLEATIGGDTQEGEGADGNASAILPWSIEKVPTQVKLIELLQFLLERAPRKVRVAMVVSAWDLVESLGVTPHEYVSREMPMLRQFLDSNSDLLEHAVFGVSAQGGSIPADKTALLAIDALERIQVCQGDEDSHDITKPIAWLLEKR
jgi:energy-coupling factor transporter ATP-binding protein EcfA2